LNQFSIEGVSQGDLEKACSKVGVLVKELKEQQLDRWAVRASLLKALYDDADDYFSQKLGTFREIAAFDNGVATALRNLKEEKV
jgi:hypothetical protein